MRIVVQRVSQASVTVEEEVVGAIDAGLLLLVGVEPDDTEGEADAAVAKLCGLRIFADDAGKMNRSLVDIGGQVLVVSQFTLLGNTRKGRRPSFIGAADPSVAEPLIDYMAAAFTAAGVETETGRFGAMMRVGLINDGPVTLILEAREGRVV